MANNFAADPTCVALFNFDNGALTTDSVGTNTLTAENTPGTDTVNFIQGDASTSLNGSNQYFHITDANLSAGFPGKSSGGSKKIAVFMRCKPTNNNYGDLIAKWWGGDNSWVLLFGAGNIPTLYFADETGNKGGDATGTSIPGGTWIDIGFLIDGSGAGGAGKMKVWWHENPSDASPQYFAWDTTNATGMVLDTGDVSIGFSIATYFTGLIDEVAIFNDVTSMTQDNFIAMSQGTYLAIPNYSREENASLPANAADLTTIFTDPERTAVSADDTNYVSQTATGKYAIFEFKQDGTGKANVTADCIFRTTLDPATSPIVLQVYKVNGTTWETRKSVSSGGTGNDIRITDDPLGGLDDYRDGNGIVTFRVYQDAS